MTQKPLLKPTTRNSDFYLIRLNTCLEEAEEATLPRVRDRCLRAAAAWQEMYEKAQLRSEEHTSELQSLMRISYAVFCLKKKKRPTANTISHNLHNNKKDTEPNT